MSHRGTLPMLRLATDRKGNEVACPEDLKILEEGERGEGLVGREPDIQKLVRFAIAKYLNKDLFYKQLKYLPKEVYNEIFTVVWYDYRRGAYEPAKATFSSWVVCRAIWAMRDLAKGCKTGGVNNSKKNNDVYSAEYESAVDQTAEDFKPDKYVLIQQLLGELSEEERRLIIDKYFRQKSLREIGREYGISAEGVRAREKKIMEKLRFVSRKDIRE